MNIPLISSSIILAVVFAVAGVTKLLDREGSRAAARSFGVPDRLVGVVGLGVPLAELATAALLTPRATRWWAAASALVLLLVFCAAIGRAIARGEAPDCHCFGQLHSAPAGWRTLARNGVLAVAAIFIVAAGRVDPGPSVFAWASKFDGLEWLVLGLSVVLAALVALGGYAMTHVLRSYGQVLVRLDAIERRLRAVGLELDEPEDVPQFGLEPGTAAPAFSLGSVEGVRVTLDDLRAPGLPVLLVFTSPACQQCSLLMPEVARWQGDHADELTVALLSDGDSERIRAEAVEHGLGHVLFDERLTVYEAYGANGTPSAVLVGDDGTIATWLAAGGDWIGTLVEQVLQGAGRTPGLPVGSELPSVRLESLDGGELDLAEIVSGPTALIFWNPGCGYCRSMHADLRTWEDARPDGAPTLIVISAGSTEDVCAEGFASTVLLDPEWAVSTALGADGTPMAVLVDGAGRIASPLASGASGALSLLGIREPTVTGR